MSAIHANQKCTIQKRNATKLISFHVKKSGIIDSKLIISKTKKPEKGVDEVNVKNNEGLETIARRY